KGMVDNPSIKDSRSSNYGEKIDKGYKLPRSWNRHRSQDITPPNNLGQCECSDPGCPYCSGACNNPATMNVHNSGMADETGIPMCDDCGGDALDSGVFHTRYENNDYDL